MARVNHKMVQKVAQKLKELPLGDVRALDFTEEDKFPSVGDPGALNYFFAVTLHDYGFWIGDERGYVEPLYGLVDGKRLKGSDLLWTLSMQIYKERGVRFFDPASLAVIKSVDFNNWLPKNKGFQDHSLRHEMVLLYGIYFMLSQNSELPRNILFESNQGSKPLEIFLMKTARVAGYNGDPLLKKNLLLAMILSNRPEKFLKVGLSEKWPPIVDYHLMRVALRLGLVDVNPGECDALVKRIWVDQEMEMGLRSRVFEAINKVIELSGRPMSEIDFLLWSARKYCPEMTEPDCPKCVFTDVCQKKTHLFQPVFRTTNY